MNDSLDTPESDEPDEQEVKKEIAEERNDKYGGRDRWFITIAFLILIPCTWWAIQRKDLRAMLLVPVCLLAGAWSFINWRSWLKKSPAERAAQPAENPFAGLSHGSLVLPCSRKDFVAAKSSFVLSMLLCFFPLLFTFLGVVSVVKPGQLHLSPVPGAIMAIGGGFLSFYFGRRFWRLSKSLSCPGCRDLLTSQGNYALETGQCRKCGRVVISDPSSSPHEQPGKSGRRTARHGVLSNGNFHYDQRRLVDIIILLSCPMAALFWLGLYQNDSRMTVLLGVMAFVIGVVFYFFPEKQSVGTSASRSKHARHSESTNTDSPEAIVQARHLDQRWDFGVLFLLPVAMAGGLFYLIWTHTVLNLAGLAAFTVLAPATIVAVSYGIARHVGYEVKRTGRYASEGFLWVMLGFWGLATFTFVVCLVSMIHKFGLKW